MTCPLCESLCGQIDLLAEAIERLSDKEKAILRRKILREAVEYDRQFRQKYGLPSKMRKQHGFRTAQ